MEIAVKRQQNMRQAYPEIGAGGFSRADGTIEFYMRISALLKPDMNVLEFGAGRGGWMSKPQPPVVRNLRTIRGRVRKLAGVDISSAVLHHPGLDEAHVIAPGGRTPFADTSFDLIYADWVLEHVDEPEAFASEIGRLLRPGGWFCARTPNMFGMTGIGANIVPNRLHEPALRFLSPWRASHDVFPTRYRMNTRRQIARLFPDNDWENYTYFRNSEPYYVQRWPLLIKLARLYLGMVPAVMATDFYVFLRKRPL